MSCKRVSRQGRLRSRLSSRSKAATIAILVLGVSGAVVGTASTVADQSRDHGPIARASHTMWVNELVRATNVSHEGNRVFYDKGYGTGTFNCPSTMEMRVYYTKGYTSISCKTSSGEIVASGKVAFFSAGATATFTGIIPITHGTNKYVHASGHYRVEGTEVRKTYAAEATTRGWFSY